jgi:cell wall-associated NlpC family hydrolase
VALDPALTVPRPGDSPGTLAARQKLETLIVGHQRAGQDYDLAAAAARAAQTRLGVAQVAAALARRRYSATHASFVELIQSQYMSGDPTGSLSAAASLLVADSPADVLDNMAMQQEMDDTMSIEVSQAQRAAAQLAAAQDRVHEAVQVAEAAVRHAAAVQTAAAVSVRQAQTLVAKLHTDDLRSAAAALEAGADSAAEASAAIKAQTLATGAATEADYAAATNPAAVIAVAADAMLEQAAGLRKAPTVPTGSGPRFTVPTPAGPVDEQAVMGPAPNLAGIAYIGRAGQLPSRALTPFDGTVSHDNWPNAGVGPDVAGTAPPIPANGTTVHPVIPAPGATVAAPSRHTRHPAGRHGHRGTTGRDHTRGHGSTAARRVVAAHPVLRAEIAVRSALEQLGSPYVWDAAGPDTFDCSGLTLWAWGHAGVSLEHYTRTQVMQGHRVEPNELLPGDLVLFGATLHHVGMYLGAGFMIDAPDTGQYVKIERIATEGDFAVAIRP